MGLNLMAELHCSSVAAAITRLENALNELGMSENGVIGQKISILAQLVWKFRKIWLYHPFWSLLGPFWHPRPKNVR